MDQDEPPSVLRATVRAGPLLAAPTTHRVLASTACKAATYEGAAKLIGWVSH